MSNFRAIRGMSDILPDETPYWQLLETTVSELLSSYGYGEIRLPLTPISEPSLTLILAEGLAFFRSCISCAMSSME